MLTGLHVSLHSHTKLPRDVFVQYITNRKHEALHINTQVCESVLHPSRSDEGLSLTMHGRNRVCLRKLAYISTLCPKSALPSLDSCAISEADFAMALVHLT